MMSEPSPIVLSAPDAGNRSAGEALRLAREAQGMTLERLASTIKVSPAKLAALEQGQYDLLPDASFTRALAMTVCRALKLDPSEVLAALPAARPVSLAAGKAPLNQPFKESKGGSPLFDRQWDGSAILSFKWLAPAALLLGAVAIYFLPDSVVTPQWLAHLLQPPAETAAAPKPEADAATEAPVPAMAPVTAEPADSAPLVAPPAVPLASAPLAPSGVASGVVPLRLDVTEPGAASGVMPGVAQPYADPRLQSAPGAINATPIPAVSAGAGVLALSTQQPSWIEVKDVNGNKLLSRNVLAGESVRLDGPAPLRILVGNATGVKLSYKGQPVDLAASTRNNVARLELK